MIAAFNGWSIAACSVISLVIALGSFSLLGLFITAALAAIAFLELRGRRRLLKLDPDACRLLGWNQFFFMLVIVGYCVWRLWEVYQHPGMPIEYPGQGISRDDWELLEELIVPILLFTYGSIIVATILVQGGNAVYYFTRRRHVLAHLAETNRASV
jgi:hypothetical protein